MGKSQKPLRIAVLPPLDAWEELQALKEQGHAINVLNDDLMWDVILGPTCWLMTEQHRKYLPLALAEARRRRYPKESREQSE